MKTTALLLFCLVVPACAFSGGQVILSTNVGGFDAEGDATLDGVKDNPQNTTEPELILQDIVAGASNEAVLEGDCEGDECEGGE